MKIFVVFVSLIILVLSAKAQTTEAKIPSRSDTTFKNQGEQEDSWAEELFSKGYVQQSFSRFKGNIILLSGGVVKYDNMTLRIYDTNSVFKIIFEKGIVYPAIIGQDSVSIFAIEELYFLDKSPQVKRFRFLLQRKNMINPSEYYMELTNDIATKQTDITTFINGSRLTFFKYAWTQI